jgi:predicted transcriptional regulator
MKKSILDRPGIKGKVVRELAVGKSQRAIGREVGISQAQISRFANKENTKELIEHEAMRLIEAVPDAVSNMRELVKALRTLPRKDHKNRELSYRATVKVLEAAGMLNTPNCSPTIVNMFQQNNTFDSPLIKGILEKFSESLKTPDSVEVDYEVDDGV